MAEITAATVGKLRDMTNAGMMDCKNALKEVVDRDILPRCRTANHIVADGVLNVQLALRLQDQDRHRRELLGYGTQVKARLGCIVDTLRAVREPIPLVEENHPVLSDQD